MHRKTRDNYEYQEVLIIFLAHKQLIFFMKQCHAKFILRLNITIPRNSQIENLDSSKYNCQSLDSICDNVCVGNGEFSISTMMVNYIYVIYQKEDILL